MKNQGAQVLIRDCRSQGHWELESQNEQSEGGDGWNLGASAALNPKRLHFGWMLAYSAAGGNLCACLHCAIH